MIYRVAASVLACAVVLPALVGTGLLYLPRRTHRYLSTRIDDPKQISQYRDVSFVTKDGVQLRGWLFEGDSPPNLEGITFNVLNSKHCLLVVHGHGAWRSGNPNRDEASVLLKAVLPLRAAGFKVLAFDLRNHGESDYAPPVSGGLYESRDVDAAAEYCQASGVWAESMGTSAVALSEHVFEATWLESPFYSLEDMVVPYLTFQCSKLGLPWLGPALALAIWQFIKIVGFPIDEVQPAARKKIGSLMVSHGTRDALIPFTQGQMFAKEHGAEFFEYDGGHVRGYEDPRYASALVAFFEKKLLTAD